MPDFVDNTAGFTAVTGTADYLMSATGTGKHLRLDQALTDGQQVAYYCVYYNNGASVADAFESGVGTWDDSENTLVVDSITNSSNGGGKISWEAGDKVLYVVHNSASLVNTDDERLVSEDVDDMTPATDITGVEKVATTQGGDPVSMTASLILADPYRQKRTHAVNRARGYSAFDRMRPTYVGTVDNSLVESEPFVLYRGGTGAQAANALSSFFVPSLLIETGSTDTGYAVVAHTDQPYLFVNTNDLDQRWHFSIPVLPTGPQDYTLQIGFVAGAPALATAGIYLELTSASPNWFQCVKNAAGTTRVDTAIAATTSVTTVRVAYSAAATESRFWINGVATTPIDDGTRVVDAFTFLAMVAGIRKSNGIVTRSIVLLHHLYDNTKGAVPHFA